MIVARDTYYTTARWFTNYVLMTLFYSAPIRIYFYEPHTDGARAAALPWVVLVSSIPVRCMTAKYSEAASDSGLRLLRYCMLVTAVVAATFPLWHSFFDWVVAMAFVAAVNPVWIIDRRDTQVNAHQNVPSRLACAMFVEYIGDAVAALSAILTVADPWVSNGLVFTGSAVLASLAVLVSSKALQVGPEYNLDSGSQNPLVKPATNSDEAGKVASDFMKRGRSWVVGSMADALMTQVMYCLFLFSALTRDHQHGIAVGALLLTSTAGVFLMTRNFTKELLKTRYIALRRHAMAGCVIAAVFLAFMPTGVVILVFGTLMLCTHSVLSEYAVQRAFRYMTTLNYEKRGQAYALISYRRLYGRLIGVAAGYMFLFPQSIISLIVYVVAWITSQIVLQVADFAIRDSPYDADLVLGNRSDPESATYVIGEHDDYAVEATDDCYAITGSSSESDTDNQATALVEVALASAGEDEEDEEGEEDEEKDDEDEEDAMATGEAVATVDSLAVSDDSDEEVVFEADSCGGEAEDTRVEVSHDLVQATEKDREEENES